MLWKALRSRVRSTVIKTGQMVVVRHHTKAFKDPATLLAGLRQTVLRGLFVQHHYKQISAVIAAINSMIDSILLFDTVRVEQVRRSAFPENGTIPCVWSRSGAEKVAEKGANAKFKDQYG